METDENILGGDFTPDTIVEFTLPMQGITVPQVLKYALIILICILLEYVLQFIPRCLAFLRCRYHEARSAGKEAWRKPRTVRKAVRSFMSLMNKWDVFTVPGLTFVLVYLCALQSLSHLPPLYDIPNNIELWTHQEERVDLTSKGVSLIAPVHDPRSESPFDPRSAATAAFFCGRPTGSGYDGFAGAPHAAYVHHDMDHDRFVLRTFGRGGTRVDHRRRTGIGRSTYEAFCGAAPSAQVGTPLAPSPHTAGEANWQLDSAASNRALARNSAVNFTLEALAQPSLRRSNTDRIKGNFLKEDQGIRTHYRRYTRDELLDRHAHMDFIYSYVNGSDITRGYTKPFAKDYLCWNLISSAQVLWRETRRAIVLFNASGRPISEHEFARSVSETLFTRPSSPCSLVHLLSAAGQGREAMARVEASLWWAVKHPDTEDDGNDGAAVPPPYALTNIELLRALGADLETAKPEDIDADSDELRHSMRGLLQHTRAWHRGRLSIVSPYANVPQWLNQSRNFFLRSLYSDALVEEKSSGMCHGPLGTAEARYVRERHTKELFYSRLHVVDQRALMPPAPLTTVNSFVIEPFVHRLRNASSLFTYMNDDYLVLKDVDVMDFVNEFGGPVLRIRHSDSMVYYEHKNDYFRRGFVFNTMRLHRDLDKLPADVEELVQPSVLDVSLAQNSGEAPQLQRGIVRGDWAAFTAAIAVHASAAPIPQNCGFGGASASVNDSLCDWVRCAQQRAGEPCEMPRVSIAGEPSWEVDAAATFRVVPTPDAGTVLSGQTQTPPLRHWGERVLDRLTADVVAPRYYRGTETVVMRETSVTPSPPEKMVHSLNVTLNALQDAVRQLGEDEEEETEARDRLMNVLSGWMQLLVEYDFPTHRTFKTQPRLRKYRVRLDSHAPYVQCRNMWGYIHKRYAPDLNLNMFLMRQRSSLDFLPPSTHTAHMLRHPWAGSSQYIPYLMAKEAWRLQVDGSSVMNPDSGEPPVFPVMDVALDNEDGCAPATYITEAKQSARYHEFRDDLAWNSLAMSRIRSYRGRKPFTNINSKFSQPSIGATLREFFHELFPTPMILEDNWVAQVGKRSFTSELSIAVTPDTRKSKMLSMKHLDAAYQKLTRLPLIVVSNDEEGFCPVLRSLRHAMPAFRGLRVVQVLVPPADGRSLHAARAEQRHAYRNFLPVTRCTLPAGRLVRVALPANSSVADVVVAGLRGAREGLAERHWAAPALVALRGLRAERRAVQAVVVDARTLHVGAAGFTELSLALATPAELLAHEDFAEMLLDGDAYAAAQPLVRRPTEEEAAQPASAVYRGEQVPAAKPADYVGSVLVLSHADAASRHVHWAHGASEHDLLSGMPLPHTGLEDMNAVVRWGL